MMKQLLYYTPDRFQSPPPVGTTVGYFAEVYGFRLFLVRIQFFFANL